MAFEDRTYDNILAEMLAMAPDGVDTRQGSIYYDAVAACALKLANFYIDASCILDLVFVWSATGEYLDRRGAECGLERNAATKARYFYIYEGTRPSAGTRFFNNGFFFTLEEDRDGVLYLVAEEAGERPNVILLGEPATPVNAILGLTISEFGRLDEPGADQEDDESYRTRIQEKIAGPAQNGNKQHYKTWCEEVDGVGRARILPLWAGENTVKAILLDTDGLPAADTIVARVQEYIDPGSTGTGEGVANIGAHFTAEAATAVPITISCAVTLTAGFSLDEARAQATETFREYLKGLALSTPESTPIVVRISSVGAMLYGLEAVVDYADLTLNGKTSNIEIDKMSVAVLEEVIVNGLV